MKQAISTLIEALPRTTTPQQMLTILWEHLLSEQVDVCSLWLYRPFGHAEITYLEQAGAFSVAAPLPPERLPIESDSPMLRRLYERMPLSPDIDPAPNPLLAAVGPDLTDWLLLPICTSERSLGCLFVGTTQPDGVLSRDLQQALDSVLPIMALNLAVHLLEYERVMATYERTALLDAVNDAVLITRTTAGQLPVLNVNGRFQYLFNVGEPITGMSLSALIDQIQIPANTRQRLRAMLRRIAKQPLTLDSGEFEMVTPAGQPAEISWYTVPLINPEDGRVFARLFIFHDATPERAAVQVRSAFLSRVSHELRTPLTAISGFAEFILQEVGDELPLVAYEYTEIIHASAQKLKYIFTDLIEMTRAYSGEVQLNFQQADAHEIIQAAIGKQQALLDEHKQTVVIEADDELPAVRMDIERMTRVFSSLLNNASHYSPPETTICVILSRVGRPAALPSSAPRDIMLPTLLMCVQDTGEGIPQEEAEYIFEPFYRARSAWKLYSDGIGLGLAVARSIVDLHRGKIWVHSPDGQITGGCVYVALPLNPEHTP